MKRWLFLIGLAGMAGCAHYQAQPLLPAQTAGRLESRRLDDSGLRHFLEQAQGHSLPVWPLPQWDMTTLFLAAFYYQPSLEVARAQWAVAVAGLKTAGARPNPVLSVTPGYDTTTAIPSPWLPLGNLDWPLETAGKRGKRVAQARDVASSARWDVVTAAWQVRANVRDALLDWQIAGCRWELLRQQYALQEHIVKRLEQRVAAGELARPELLAPRIALQKSQLDVLDSRVRSEDARTRLAAAIGLPVSALEGVTIAVDIGTNTAATLTVPAARKVALQTRSDILRALADYAAAEDGLRLEIAKQYPDVHVAPGYQFNQGDNQWLLGFSVELPVLNQNQGPIAEAEARRRLAAAKFRALQAQVIGQIDQALASYQMAHAQLSAAVGLLAAEKGQQASVHAQLQAGSGDQFDVLTAQAEQNTVALGQLDYLAQERHALGALEDALQRPLDSFTVAALQRAAASPNEQVSPP